MRNLRGKEACPKCGGTHLTEYRVPRPENFATVDMIEWYYSIPSIYKCQHCGHLFEER